MIIHGARYANELIYVVVFFEINYNKNDEKCVNNNKNSNYRKNKSF